MKRVLLAVGVLLALSGCSTHPPKTERADLSPFTSTGRLKSGYQLDKSTYRTLLDFGNADDWVPDASPYGTSPNTYEVGPTAIHAAACWASPTDRKALLCPVDPWSKRLRVYGVTQRPATKARKHPQPYGLELSDGSHYEARVGGAVAPSSNNWSPTFYCVGTCAGGFAIVANEKHSIDRVQGRWYVYVGEPVMDKPLKPKRLFVTRALFVG